MRTVALMAGAAALVMALGGMSLVYADNQADKYYNEGLERHKAGELDEAIRLYNKALDEDMKHREAMYALGAAYFDKGDMAEAEKALKDTVLFYPRFTRALAFLGETQLALGKFGEARDNFLKALADMPDSIPVLVGLGKAEYFEGNSFAGEEYLKRALSLDPENKQLQETVTMIRKANRDLLRAEAAEKRQRIIQAFNEAVYEAGRRWTMAQEALEDEERARAASAGSLYTPDYDDTQISTGITWSWSPWYPWICPYPCGRYPGRPVRPGTLPSSSYRPKPANRPWPAARPGPYFPYRSR